MKKACLVVDSAYQQNEIFKKDSWLNRDNCLQFFQDLQSEFLKYNIQLTTQDVVSMDEADYVIYNDMPKKLPRREDQAKSHLLLFESELIRPDNWDLKNHQLFKNIFTWYDPIVDQRKYFKFNFSHHLSQQQKKEFLTFAQKNKFCTLIAGHKYVKHPQELYSKRVEAIRWFEKNQPEFFELYGIGWDLHTFTGPLICRAFNRIKYFRKLFSKKWPSYQGKVKDKFELLKTCKFSICYENAFGIEGYITEKILDSLAAGCIPVYWGAPNIAQFIPESCFIRRENFTSYESLWQYLSTMTENEYNQRLLAIQKFLTSPEHQAFESLSVARSVVRQIVSNDGVYEK